jgi:hypothetical protein
MQDAAAFPRRRRRSISCTRSALLALAVAATRARSALDGPHRVRSIGRSGELAARVRYDSTMVVLARVQRGRLVVDEPTDLSEGAEVALEMVEDPLAEELSAAERARLEASIEIARDHAERGEGVNIENVLATLRAHRR